MAKRQKAYGRKVWLWTIGYLGGRCAKCGATEDLTIDHTDPTSKDRPSKAKGSDSRAYEYRKLALAGLAQCLCRPCNSSKGTKLSDSDIEEMIASERKSYA